MNHKLIFPIVGSFYRPPAKAILNSIPVGTPLELRAEPSNPADSNAIAVWIRTSAIPESAHKQLILSGADCGFRIGTEPSEDPESFLESILIEPEWHLGYIPAVIAKTPSAREMIANGPIPGRFLILDGKPAVENQL